MRMIWMTLLCCLAFAAHAEEDAPLPFDTHMPTQAVVKTPVQASSTRSLSRACKKPKSRACRAEQKRKPSVIKHKAGSRYAKKAGRTQKIHKARAKTSKKRR